jgi:hypothetical protein
MMKKTVLCGLASAALLAVGCTNDEVVEIPASKAITFANAFVNNNTKADPADPSYTSTTTVSETDGTSTVTTTLSDFNVYGYVTVSKDNATTSSEIFTGDKVSKGSDGSWSYDNTQYWIAGGKYLFTAVAPSGITGTVTTALANDKASVNTTITNFEHKGLTDLLYAEDDEVGYATDNSVVAFTFKHLLSKVKFTFSNGFPSTSNVSLKVTGVKIKDAYSKGTVVYTSAADAPIAWTPSTVAADKKLELSFGDVASTLVPVVQTAKSDSDSADTKTDTTSSTTTAVSSASAANQRLLIPSASTATYTVEFNVELLQGKTNPVSIKTYTVEGTISNQAFVAGYAYNISATLTEKNVNSDSALEPIVFTVSSITDWVSATDGTLNIPEKTTTNTNTDSTGTEGSNAGDQSQSQTSATTPANKVD